MRLQKYLADSGVASRRASEKLILEGRVSVNGETITEMGYVVEDGDTVRFDGKVVTPVTSHEYWAFYKPGGIVCTVKDPEGRKTIMDFYKGHKRVYPIGRLDYDSEGLLLLTTDGDYANRMMHPRYEKEKVYEVTLDRPLLDEDIKKLTKGMELGEHKLRPIEIKKRDDFYLFTLHEGRNRQIRRMVESVGYHVVKLKRIRIGTITLGSLQSGQMRKLSKLEIERSSK
ncbi:pseudouridine synthase [Guggenheimella bovis]